MSRLSRVLGFLSLAMLAILAGPSKSAAPAEEQAKVAPEELMPAAPVFYFRYDGMANHHERYEQTALAEMMKGDMGQFVDHCFAAIHKFLPRATEDMTPDQRRFVMGTLPAFFDQVGKHGVVMGVEITGILPMPQGQVTMVFPDAAGKADMDTCFQTLATMAEMKVKDVQMSGRTVHRLETPEPMHVAWWNEGKHVVLICGTEQADQTLKRIDAHDKTGKSTSGFSHPLKLRGTCTYEPVVSAFVDLACVRRILADLPIPGMGSIIDGLGLNGVNAVTYNCGFESKSLRSTVTVQTTGERKGLVKLATASQVDLSKLPPVPPDATDIAVFQLDLAAVYDQAYAMGKTLIRMYAPDQWAEIDNAIKQANTTLGIDVRNDLLAQLGPTVVTYNSPSEGMSLLGLGFAMQVKDADKLQSSLEKLSKAVAEMAQVDVTLKKRPYHGMDVHTVSIAEKGRATGFQCTPSYCLHNGWLVAGLFPHRVQGYILRATENYPKWEPSPLLTKTLAEIQKNPKLKILSVSEIDPRPTITTMLSLAPIGEGLLHTFVPDGFDPVMVPHAHNVCRSLFPNVSVTVDDGETIRMESYSSAPLPSISGSLVGAYLVAGLMNSDFEIPNIAGDFNINVTSPGAPPLVVQSTPVSQPQTDGSGGGVYVERIPVDPQVVGEKPRPKDLPFVRTVYGTTPVAYPPGTVVVAPPAATGQALPAPFRSAMPQPMIEPPTCAPAPYPMPVQPVTYAPAGAPMPMSSAVRPTASPAVSLTYLTPQSPPPPTSTPSSTAVKMVTKVYPVGDLVHQEQGYSWEQTAEQLIQHVQIVEPKSWNTKGGPAMAAVYAATETMTVHQTLEAHEQIERLLNDMRLHSRKTNGGSTRSSSTFGKP